MFDSVLADIESVFASSNWTSNNIDIYPENYQGAISDDTEFCRLSVLPSSSENYVYGAKKLLSGLVAVKIFVKAGEGQNRIMGIGDILDLVLETFLEAW